VALEVAEHNEHHQQPMPTDGWQVVALATKRGTNWWRHSCWPKYL